jgi:hypothetical protein
MKRNDVTSISAGVIGGDNFSEEIQVVDKALQSDNYVPFESGWKIDGSGNAEFGNVYVRGDINAQTGTIGYWNISTPSVTRTFGTTTLFGTFLESQNLGGSDTGATGTYVGLFKSFIEADGALSAIARDADGNAVVTVVGHNYLVGDLVTITVDSVAGFSTGSTPVRIIAITTDTFSYASPGSAVATTETTGTVVFVNPDVSGLYLRDYSKANFDYGYVSNAGLAYVSAETLNLVYNSSFEYTDTATYDVTAATASSTTIAVYTVDSTATTNPFTVDQKINVNGVTPSYFNGAFFVTSIGGSAGAWTATVTDSTAPFTAAGTGTVFGSITSITKPSTASWDTSAGGALSSWSFISTLRDYASASSYGAYAVWTTTPPTYKFRATVGYNTGDSYKLFTGDRPLYFKYDTFLNYQPYQATISNFVSTSGSVSTITTSTAHGLQTGNIVYLDFTAIGSMSGPGGAAVDLAINEVDSFNLLKIFPVLSTPTATTFTIENNRGFGVSLSAVVTTGIQPRGGGTARAKNVYKVVWPVIDLSEVLFVFPNGTTTSLYSVLDSATKAAWDASTAYKYKTIHPETWMLEYLDPVDGIGPLITDEIVIDGSALRDIYASSDTTNFLTKANIKLQLPAKPYSQTFTNGYDTTYTSVTGVIHTSYASITAISYTAGTITYTAPNNFVPGDYVSVTGAISSQYNITNVKINTATSTNFTVSLTVTAGTTSAAAATGYKNVNTIIDEVSISTEPTAFYGNTSSSYYWKDSTLNSPSQVSVQGPKKWIDIDLDTQTGTLANLDYVGFKPSYLSHPLVTKPNISSIYSASSSAALFDLYDYEQLDITSGTFSKANITDTGVNNFSSRATFYTGDAAAMAEMVSYAYDQEASVRTYAEYKNSRVVIDSAYTQMTGALQINSIYPRGSSAYNNYSYHETPPTWSDGDITLYGGAVNIGESADPVPTSLWVNGTAHFADYIDVTGYVSVGDVLDASGTITGGNFTTAGSITRTSIAQASSTGASLSAAGALVRTSSSERYKQDIEDASYTYEDILLLSPKTFRLKEEAELNPNSKVYGGLIAEEVDKINSLRVFVSYITKEDGLTVPDGIQYGEMVSALVLAIKYQDGVIKSLESRITALESI